MRYCLGADVMDQRSMSMTRFVAPVTMLATGGAGQVYPNTTNPAVTTGDGIAMAYRCVCGRGRSVQSWAGLVSSWQAAAAICHLPACPWPLNRPPLPPTTLLYLHCSAKAAVANMEFVQFHPTSLYAPACPGYPADSGAVGGAAGNSCTLHQPPGRSFLITEAVRGEGGTLHNLGGERFMPRYDSRLELAPRDIVARSIQSEMRVRGSCRLGSRGWLAGWNMCLRGSCKSRRPAMELLRSIMHRPIQPARHLTLPLLLPPLINPPTHRAAERAMCCWTSLISHAPRCWLTSPTWRPTA